jgi:hypothetical protein
MMLGIGSAGDSACEIRLNILFFKDHDLDFAICACSVKKEGRELINGFSLLRKAHVLEVKTKTLSKSDKKGIEIECEAKANEIVGLIRS